MKKSSQLGMNRTGIQLSPLLTREMKEGMKHRTRAPREMARLMARVRSDYNRSAPPIGSVPIPGSLKGLAKSTMKKLRGQSPEVFIDHLAGRLAFERTGTRIYDALLLKCQARREEAFGISEALLRRFRDEEWMHFHWLTEAIEKLGGDPTAQTPAADIMATESQGLLQVLNDPRTEVIHCLSAILAAELVDRDGWRLLIRLADALGLDDMAENFRVALREELVHLATVREWYARLVAREASVSESGVLVQDRRELARELGMEDGHNPRTPVRAELQGALAGMLGSWAQLQFFKNTKEWTPGQPENAFQPPEEQQTKEGSTETVARRWVEGLMKSGPLTDEQKRRAGAIVHFAFGSLWGATYGMLRESSPAFRGLKGAALFSTLVWMLSDNLILPSFRLSGWPQAYPAKNHLYAWTAHIAYGSAVWAGYLALDRTVERVQERRQMGMGALEERKLAA